MKSIFLSLDHSIILVKEKPNYTPKKHWKRTGRTKQEMDRNVKDARLLYVSPCLKWGDSASAQGGPRTQIQSMPYLAPLHAPACIFLQDAHASCAHEKLHRSKCTLRYTVWKGNWQKSYIFIYIIQDIPYSCLAVGKSVANVHFLLPDISSPGAHISFAGVLVKAADPFWEIIAITP
jgi:hypothetical protein